MCMQYGQGTKPIDFGRILVPIVATRGLKPTKMMSTLSTLHRLEMTINFLHIWHAYWRCQVDDTYRFWSPYSYNSGHQGADTEKRFSGNSSCASCPTVSLFGILLHSDRVQLMHKYQPPLVTFIATRGPELKKGFQAISLEQCAWLLSYLVCSYTVIDCNPCINIDCLQLRILPPEGQNWKTVFRQYLVNNVMGLISVLTIYCSINKNLWFSSIPIMTKNSDKVHSSEYVGETTSRHASGAIGGYTQCGRGRPSSLV